MILLVIIGVSIACDISVWIRYFRKTESRGWGSILHVVQSVLLDVILPLAVYVVMTYGGRGAVAYGVLWMVWLLVLSLVSKLVFVVFLMINGLSNKLFRKKWRVFEAVGTVCVMLIVGVMIYGVTYGVSTIKVNRIIITSPKIPSSFDGYRIAHFSDLHIGNLSPFGTLMEDMIDTIVQLKPDMIVNTGDLINLESSEITPPIFNSLKRLEAPDGVVSVLGNHDLGIYMSGDDNEMEQSLRQLKEIKRRLGWHLLQNRNISVKRNNDSIMVAGVDYPLGERYGGKQVLGTGSDLALAMRGVDSSQFSFLVAHTPSIWDSIPQVASPDLTVAGHTHAMQMKFKTKNSRFSPAEFIYNEWSGIYVKNGLRLYVNDGIGYVLFPMRIGAPPEVTLYELRSGDE